MTTVQTTPDIQEQTNGRVNGQVNGQVNGDYPVTLHPMDEHNREMLGNAHPGGWQNPQPSGKYNLVVIGSGTAGIISAVGAAGLGAKVALIERELLGGDCLVAGCVPSKSIIRPAKVIGEIAKGREMGINVPEEAVSVDFGRVMERLRAVRAEIGHDEKAQRFVDDGIDLYLGSGRFTGPNTVEVISEHGEGDRTLTFSKAVIATGSSPRSIPIPGLDEAGYLTNETLFQLTEQPRRMAVIGSGPIGSEMSQTFNRLGTEVTILEKMGQIMTREDREAAKIVQDIMEDEGVNLVLNADIERVESTPSGKVIHYTQGGEAKTVEVDAILLSVGRAPRVEGMGLEAAGVEYTNRGVQTDDNLRTTNENIYAAGDVGQKYQFTHMADATARIVLQNALFPGPKAKHSQLIVPWCTFTDPQIAHVGMYEQEAEEQGIAVQTFVQPFDDVDRPRTDGETRGFVKVHVKKGTDKVLGATIVGTEAGEMVSEITTLMVAGKGLKTLNNVIHPYPVQAEAIKKIAGQWNRTRLSPLLSRVLKLWMAWQR